MKQELSQLLLNWYKENARSLPWRGHPDPYAVWVSEIMLQQTRVDTVIPYFKRWLQKFPDVHSLANATEDEVLNTWEGLGYYSRARSMHKAARLIIEKHDGSVPRDYSDLIKLPGVGPYTAAAIASIAFGANEAVLDGNVKRVLARLLNYTQPVNTQEAEIELRGIARSLLPDGQAGDYNQALMDLGAMICTPRSPACSRCPLNSICMAYAQNLQAQLPVILKRLTVPHYTVTAAILERDGKVFIAKRPSTGLLGGMWEFPGGKVEPDETHAQALIRELREELGINADVLDLFGKYKHAYTHFKVTLYAYLVHTADVTPRALFASEIQWVALHDLQEFPMGKIDRMISRDLVNRGFSYG